jgi:prepilin-type N-terminal cleavage/methylation domain-containing protein
MRHPKGSAGFSLIEVLLVVSLVGILSGIGVSLLGGWIPRARADAASRLVAYQLIAAREQALGERRNIEVKFVGNDQIQLVKHELPTGETILRTVPLEYSVKFHKFTNISTDTPDAFGFPAATYFGGAQSVMFTSDGSMIDDLGVPVNGTILLGLPENVLSARGVTVFGGTGRVRSYRWSGTKWEQM